MLCYKCKKTVEGEPECCPHCGAVLPSILPDTDVSTDQRHEAACIRYANALGRGHADTYIKGDPVPKWMDSLKKTLRADIETKDVLFARNLALLAAGKSGFIFTAYAFYYKNVGEREKVLFADVADVRSTDSDSPICVFRASAGRTEAQKTVFVSYIVPVLTVFVRLYCLRHGLELENFPAPSGGAVPVPGFTAAASEPERQPELLRKFEIKEKPAVPDEIPPEPEKPEIRPAPEPKQEDVPPAPKKTETPPEPKKYVFISYSSKNTAAATNLRALFEEGGVNTWMAPGSIPPGSNYLESVNRAVKGCACVVLLLTEEAQQSKWVYKELERAINADKTIFPVQFGPVALTDAFEFMLSTSQFITVSPDATVGENERALLEAVRRFTN